MKLLDMAPEIRTAKPEDAVFACRALRRSISECCMEDHRNDNAILAAWLDNKTPETVRRWFDLPCNMSLVAATRDDIVGVAILSRAGKILLCHVTPEARFTGTGKALLQAMESQARQWKLPALQVVSTLTAKSFYLRNGFAQGGTTTSLYGSEAIVFSKRLCASYPKKTCGCAA